VEAAQKDIEKFHAEQTEMALALSMERIQELENAHGAVQVDLIKLREDYSLATQKIKTLGRCCHDTEHAAQIKAILASGVGGKCERIHEVDGSLHDMAHAAVAQRRKMVKLLHAAREQHGAALRTFAVAKTHLNSREREAVEGKKRVMRELADSQAHERDLVEELAACHHLATTARREASEAKDQVQTVIAKNGQLDRKYQRSKGNAQTFYDQEKKALCERDAALVERDAALAKQPMCAICFDRDVQLVINLPCGHVCVCENCSDTTRPCPICRDGISVGLPAYFASE
jgi:hypothetical protein